MLWAFNYLLHRTKGPNSATSIILAYYQKAQFLKDPTMTGIVWRHQIKWKILQKWDKIIRNHSSPNTRKEDEIKTKNINYRSTSQQVIYRYFRFSKNVIQDPREIQIRNCLKISWLAHSRYLLFGWTGRASGHKNPAPAVPLKQGQTRLHTCLKPFTFHGYMFWL